MTGEDTTAETRAKPRMFGNFCFAFYTGRYTGRSVSSGNPHLSLLMPSAVTFITVVCLKHDHKDQL